VASGEKESSEVTDPKDKVKQDLIDKGISAEDAQYIIDHGWVENSAGKEYIMDRAPGGTRFMREKTEDDEPIRESEDD
jgi:isopentenyl diphosphate isomerase/L-lactate dehydrogenase-like FMN-dependent dehydrogenase